MCKSLSAAIAAVLARGAPTGAKQGLEKSALRYLGSATRSSPIHALDALETEGGGK